MMKIDSDAPVMVTGATGFLGSHCAEQLQLAGNDVTCPVRLGSDTSFLNAIGVNIETVNFQDAQRLGRIGQSPGVVRYEGICEC